MFILRRAALRVTSSRITASTSRPRTFTSLSAAPSTSSLRPLREQQWFSVAQRRFNSEDAARSGEEKTTDETVTETLSASEEAVAAEAQETSAPASADVQDEQAVASAVSSSSGTETTTAQQVSEAAAESVQSAIDTTAAAVGGTFAGGDRAEDRQDRRQFVPREDEKMTTLYVGNLFFQTNEDQLRQEFSKFGNILRTAIIRDPAGLSRGFGYVEFDSEDAAAVAIVQMNQRVIDGRRLTVQHHKRRTPEDGQRRTRRRIDTRVNPNPPSKTLFIGNMSFEMSDRDLNDLFREIRNVLDVRVAIDRRTGQPRGFAHADFIDETSATKAKAILENKEVYGRRLRVDYSRSNKQE